MENSFEEKSSSEINSEEQKKQEEEKIAAINQQAAIQNLEAGGVLSEEDQVKFQNLRTAKENLENTEEAADKPIAAQEIIIEAEKNIAVEKQGDLEQILKQKEDEYKAFSTAGNWGKVEKIKEEIENLQQRLSAAEKKEIASTKEDAPEIKTNLTQNSSSELDLEEKQKITKDISVLEINLSKDQGTEFSIEEEKERERREKTEAITQLILAGRLSGEYMSHSAVDMILKENNIQPMTAEADEFMNKFDKDEAQKILESTDWDLEKAKKFIEEKNKLLETQSGGNIEIKEENDEFVSPIKKEPEIIIESADKPKIVVEEKSKTETISEIKQELKELPREQREKLGLGLNNIGFFVEQKKNQFFAKIFDSAAKKFDKKGTMGRFVFSLRETFERDAKSAEKNFKNIASGREKHQFRNAGYLFGNIIKYGRTIVDIIGTTTTYPLRYVMMGGMIFSRVSEAAKEGRLKNEKVIEKTRIQDANAAADEAWKIYEQAKLESPDEKVSVEELNKAYQQNIPADLLQRLEKKPGQMEAGTANGIIQKVTKKKIEWSVKRLNNKIKEIENNEDWKKDRKKREKEKLFNKYEKILKDYDRIVSQYGTIDALSMATKGGELLGKTAVAAATIETLYVAGEKLWETVSGIFTHAGLETLEKPAVQHDEKMYQHDEKLHDEKAEGTPKENMKETQILESEIKNNGALKELREKFPFFANDTTFAINDSGKIIRENHGGAYSLNEKGDLVYEDGHGRQILKSGSAKEDWIEEEYKHEHGSDEKQHEHTEEEEKAEHEHGESEEQNEHSEEKKEINDVITMAEKNIEQLATIQKGEGVSHAVLRQLQQRFENDPNHLGFKGDAANEEEIHKFLLNKTVSLLKDQNIIKEDGTEIRISEPGAKVFLGDDDIIKIEGKTYEWQVEKPAISETTSEEAQAQKITEMLEKEAEQQIWKNEEILDKEEEVRAQTIEILEKKAQETSELIEKEEEKQLEQNWRLTRGKIPVSTEEIKEIPYEAPETRVPLTTIEQTIAFGHKLGLPEDMKLRMDLFDPFVEKDFNDYKMSFATIDNDPYIIVGEQKINLQNERIGRIETVSIVRGNNNIRLYFFNMSSQVPGEITIEKGGVINIEKVRGDCLLMIENNKSNKK